MCHHPWTLRSYDRTLLGMCRVRALDDIDYYSFKLIATDKINECFGVAAAGCRMIKVGKIDNLYYESMAKSMDNEAATLSADESSRMLHWGTRCAAAWDDYPIPLYPMFAGSIINRATWRDRATFAAK